jgi:hypothetical protein
MALGMLVIMRSGKLTVGLATVVLAVASCEPGERRFGEILAGVTVIPVRALIGEAASHAGKKVQLEGRIVDVCPVSGCWFVLEDSGAAVLVDLKESASWTLPHRVKGMPAVVQGVVRLRDGELVLAGRGV